MNQQSKQPPGLSANQVARKISAYLAEFQYIDDGKSKVLREIKNVSFLALTTLYKIMQAKFGTEKVRLFMSGELQTEGMLIIYMPVPGFTIAIESEPVVDFCWRIRNQFVLVNIN